MLTQEDKIRLIHEFRNALLNHMFDELYRRSKISSTQQASDDIVATAELIHHVIADSNEIRRPTRGLFVLALQQVVDFFIAGLLTDEAFEWMADEQRRMDQILFEGLDPIGGVQ
jgi:hypothetical protein